MATTQVDKIHSNFELNDILQQTQATSRRGGFRRVLGAIAGGAANMFAPGVGGLIGSIISGSGGPGGLLGGFGGLGGLGGFGGAGGFTGLGSETLQFLQIQQQVQLEMRAFEMAVSIFKARHDTSMSAIRAMGGR
jgi:hypothetical protein